MSKCWKSRFGWFWKEKSGPYGFWKLYWIFLKNLFQKIFRVEGWKFSKKLLKIGGFMLPCATKSKNFFRQPFENFRPLKRLIWSGAKINFNFIFIKKNQNRGVFKELNFSLCRKLFLLRAFDIFYNIVDRGLHTGIFSDFPFNLVDGGAYGRVVSSKAFSDGL